jgi:hypothetical protein
MIILQKDCRNTTNTRKLHAIFTIVYDMLTIYVRN